MAVENTEPKTSAADRSSFALNLQVQPVDMSGWTTERKMRLMQASLDWLKIVDEKPPMLEMVKS